MEHGRYERQALCTHKCMTRNGTGPGFVWVKDKVSSDDSCVSDDKIMLDVYSMHYCVCVCVCVYVCAHAPVCTIRLKASL